MGQLVWATTDGTRLDPNTVRDHVQGELTDSLTDPEKQLVKLFEKAPRIKTVSNVNAAVAAWAKSAPKTITQDKNLMTGIRHALGMLVGLKPADFSD